jgi:hypothetical protein
LLSFQPSQMHDDDDDDGGADEPLLAEHRIGISPAPPSHSTPSAGGRATIAAPSTPDRCRQQTPSRRRQKKTKEKHGKQLSDVGFYTVITIVAFVQGCSHLSSLVKDYLFKDNFNLSPAAMAVASGFIAVPWVIKPLYGCVPACRMPRSCIVCYKLH